MYIRRLFSSHPSICCIKFDELKKTTKGKDRIRSLKTRGLYLEVTLFYFISEELWKCGLYLQGDLYSRAAFNTGLTVNIFSEVRTTWTKIHQKYLTLI